MFNRILLSLLGFYNWILLCGKILLILNQLFFEETFYIPNQLFFKETFYQDSNTRLAVGLQQVSPQNNSKQIYDLVDNFLAILKLKFLIMSTKLV